MKCRQHPTSEGRGEGEHRSEERGSSKNELLTPLIQARFFLCAWASLL